MASRTLAEGDWLSTTSRLDDDGEGESDSDMDHETPRHPVPKMQGAFEESMMETMQEVPEDDLDDRFSTADSISRRKILLEQDHYERRVAGKWKQKPGENFHPLWKLVAQISFGMHLLSQGLAKSDEEVMKILQAHVDEIDGFLERTTADFDLAHEDIAERIRCLRLPLEHGDVFDTMLEDRSFRIAIVEGNEKIEHIVNRTNAAMKDALKDVQKGLDGTRELTKYLTQLQKTWLHRTEEHQAVDSAMIGNTEGWTRAFMTLQSKGAKLAYGLSELGGIISRIQTRAGIASRKNIPPPRTVQAQPSSDPKASPASVQRIIHQPSPSESPRISFPMPPASRPVLQSQHIEDGIGGIEYDKSSPTGSTHKQKTRSLMHKLKKRPPSSLSKSPVSPQSRSTTTLLDGTSSLPSPASTFTGGRSRPLSTVKGAQSLPQQVTIRYDLGEESDQLSPLPFEKSMSEYMLYQMNEPSSPRSLSSFKNSSKGDRFRNSLNGAQNQRPPSPQKDTPPPAVAPKPHLYIEEAPPAGVRRSDSASSRHSSVRSSIDFLKSPSVRSSIHIDYFEDAAKQSEPSSPKSTKSRTKEVRFAKPAAGKPIKAMLVELPLRHYKSQEGISRRASGSSGIQRASSLKMSKPPVLPLPDINLMPRALTIVPVAAVAKDAKPTFQEEQTALRSPTPTNVSTTDPPSTDYDTIPRLPTPTLANGNSSQREADDVEDSKTECSTAETPRPDLESEPLTPKPIEYFPVPLAGSTASSLSSRAGATPPPIATSKPSLAPLSSLVLTKTPASDTSSNRSSASTASTASETSSTLASFPKPPSSSASTPRSTPQPPQHSPPSSSRQNSATQAASINPLLAVPASPPAQHAPRLRAPSPRPTSPAPSPTPDLSSPQKPSPKKPSPPKTPSPDFTLSTPATISSFDVFPTDFSSFDADGAGLTSATLFPTRQMPSPLLPRSSKSTRATTPTATVTATATNPTSTTPTDRPSSYTSVAASPAPPPPNGATLPAGRIVVLDATRGAGATFGTARLQEEDRRMQAVRYVEPESGRTTAASSRRPSIGEDSVRSGSGGGGAWKKLLGSKMGTLVGRGRKGEAGEKARSGLGMGLGNDSRRFMGMGKDGVWVRGRGVKG